jgi:hypothetical protein
MPQCRISDKVLAPARLNKVGNFVISVLRSEGCSQEDLESEFSVWTFASFRCEVSFPFKIIDQSNVEYELCYLFIYDALVPLLCYLMGRWRIVLCIVIISTLTSSTVQNAKTSSMNLLSTFLALE